MGVYERAKCGVPDCENFQRNKGMLHGRRIFGRLCDFHHRKGDGMGAKYFSHINQRLANAKCEECGWDKAYCDRHRLDPKLGYTRDNIKILCPNCHRLAEIKKRAA